MKSKAAGISKTAMLALVRAFRWADVRRGLDAAPELLAFRDDRGRNWLHICCAVHAPESRAKDSVKTAEVLLDKGLDIDGEAFTEGAWKATPLWYAIGRGGNLVLAEYLLKRGCNPNYGLFAASWNDDIEAIRLLVRRGADVDDPSAGQSPFLDAVKFSRFRPAEVLLGLGADPNTRDRNGMTALHCMLKKGSDRKHVAMLIAHGARGDIEDAKGVTAIDILSRKRDPGFRKMAEQLAATR
jgi:ankyrin repeat protein